MLNAHPILDLELTPYIYKLNANYGCRSFFQMAGVVQFFLNEFSSVHQNDEYVDLSDLVQKLKNFTPIPLRCTKPEESVQNLPAVVIMNFSSHYGEKLKISFPNKGFKALANIVQRNGSDIHTRAQLTLMVHITKMEIQVWLAVLLFMKIEGLLVHTSLTQQLEQWKYIVLKTINHPRIIKLIEDLINEVLGPNTEIKKVDKYPMQIHFISLDFPTLRGFSGINELFINENYFLAKISEWKLNVRLLELITKMDLITIGLHEYAHVRIRQQVDDINMSTPNMLQYLEIDKPKCDQEFGRLAEINLFNEQINWFQSKETININYIEQFLNAIENETELPVLTGNDGAIPREPSIGMGVDILNDRLFC